MNENKISEMILDVAFNIHRELGPGLLEKVYEKILSNELRKKGVAVECQVPIGFSYNGEIYDEGFRSDVIVDGKVIVELKSVEQIHDIHKKQLLTYLKLSKMKLGLLINFNEMLLKNGITRIVNGL